MTSGRRTAGRPIRTRLLCTPTGEVEYLVTGTGEPVTVYGHGLAGSIAETRTFASGVAGTSAFLHFRGHGRTRASDDRWDHEALAGELLAVADAVGATRALGVSLGAAALVALLGERPDRFGRVVLALPAAPGGGTAATRWAERLADRLAAADTEGVADVLLGGQHPAVGELPAARRYYRTVAERLVASRADLLGALRSFPYAPPGFDTGRLARVTAPVLVVAQPDDLLHPEAAAHDLSAAFPNGRVRVLDEPGGRWFGAAELREVVSGFLNERSLNEPSLNEP